MSLSSFFENRKDFDVIPISNDALVHLAGITKDYCAAVVGNHTHMITTDASISCRGKCGLGIVLYDAENEHVQISAIRVHGVSRSVEGELRAIEEMAEFLPVGANPLFIFDQRWVITYLKERKLSDPKWGPAQPYIDSAHKIERKFSKFGAWWAASKEGELTHSIADAVAGFASSGRVKNHQTDKYMSLDRWTDDYDFDKSCDDYDKYLLKNPPWEYKK